MTENEAINELQANIDLPFGFTVSDEVSEIAIQALKEIQQYKAIGTVEEFKALKEKNEPKKAIAMEPTNKHATGYLACPICHCIVCVDDMKSRYCPDCGQNIAYESEE